MAARRLDVLVVHRGPGLGHHDQVNVQHLANYVDQVATYVVFPLTGAPTQFVSIHPWLPMGEIVSVIDDVRLGSAREVADPVMPYPWTHPSGRRIAKGDVILAEISAGFWRVAGATLRTLQDIAVQIEEVGFTIQCPVVHGWGQRLRPPFCGIPGVPAWRSDPDTRFEQSELVVTPAGGRSLHKVPLDLAALE